MSWRWTAVLALLAAVVAGCGESPDAESPEAPARPAVPATWATDSAAVAFTSFRTRTWGVDDGLLGRTRHVAQTQDGYLWVTTDAGLFRFDGARFVPFTTTTVPVFQSDDLLSVNALDSGDLWVGSHDGWTYRFREGEWSAHDISDALGPGAWVQEIVQDGNGAVWAAGTGRSVARFDAGKWSPIEQKIRDVWTPFVVDKHGTIWTYLDASDAPGMPPSPLHTRPPDHFGVVARWDGERFTPPQDWRLFGFEPTQHGPLFHRPADGADAPTTLAAARGLRVQLTDVDGTPRGEYVIGDVLHSAHLVDRAGRVWTEPVVADGSLTVFDGDTEIARIRPAGSKWIERVFEDRQGNVWVLSSGGTLLQVTPEPFRRFGPDEGAPLGAESAVVTADGTILISATEGAQDTPLFIVRDGAWTSRTLSPGPAEFPGIAPGRAPTVGMVTEDGSGRRFGTYGSRLVQLEGDRAERFWQSPNGHSLQLPFPDSADPDALWVGDERGTLWRFDTEAFAPTDSFALPRPALGSSWPTDIHRAPDGRLWVASRGGLMVRVEEGRLRPVDGLADVLIRDLADGPDGALWAATETHGLVRIREGDIDAFGLDEGLPTSHIEAVLFDDHGFAWLRGRALLHRVRVADIERALDGYDEPVDVVTLPPSAGHLGSSNLLVHAAKDRDGALWIPSDQGVTRIDPAAYARQFAEPPPVLIETVQTESEPIELASRDASVRLPRGERSPTIEYTAIDLTAPDLVRFRTRLQGLDDTWQDQGGARSVVYGRLGPGTYTFEVQARNGGGVWSEPASATVVVPAFFYETGWFAALCGLGLLAALILGVRARERSQKARQRQLEALVDERTGQLQAEKETVAAQAQSLETLDRAKSQFFANVSHEFRTPLTLTLGPLDDVLSGEYGPLLDDAASQLSLARRSAGRVLGLINQILDVSRLEAGSTPLRARPLDLSAFASAQVDAFTPWASHRQLEVEIVAPEAPVEVWAAPEHLGTILSNLLSNAFKFTPEHGTIRIEIAEDGERASLTVRDTGPGIADADLPHIFDRFYQAEGPANQPLGSGIGLALAFELAALHGGTVTAESEVGKGSAFTLALPLGHNHLDPHQLVDTPWDGEPVAMPAVETPTPTESDIELAPTDAATEDVTTVLVVDDNPDIRAYLRRHLDSAGYRVVEAVDGEDALDRIQAHLPDLIVSDVMMPRLDGLGLCRAIRSSPETDFIPVLLLTAKASPEDQLDGLAELCDDYLTKPFDVRQLVARVENLIAIRKRLRVRFGGDGAPPTRTTPVSADDAFVASVREAIDERLSDDTFGVAALAEAVGQSRSHLLRKTTALLGASPSELIRTARLDRAAELLAARAGTVSEVAYGVGFKSVAHFSNAFLAHTGSRPSAYAKAES